MKRRKLSTVIISALMTLTIATSLVGCGEKSKADDAGITFKAGTYEATAKGHNADLKLSVTVDETSIKEINILEHNESPGISDPAFEKVPNEIIETQSVNVDSVSGATVSSMAIITAVTEAIKQSGVDIDALNKRAEGNEVAVEDVEKTTDVLVIGAGGAGMAKALFEQTDDFMWIVVDQHSYPTGDTKNNFNETIDELVEAGRAYKADTLEELAEMMGVDKDNFINAVNKFNEAVDGAEDEFEITLFANKIDTAPFYAASRKPTVHHTMGGVKINTNTEVVNIDGNVISGLFAAGEVTGGIHGSNRLGGNALADITVFGRIAGENAAKAKK